ncbi:MAG TPA: DUF2892 domain-containing protein [Gammaproteobacteria bacterium]|nr:DUF2892 domain-containing protein [Gammaproteobacteria bacterium]
MKENVGNTDMVLRIAVGAGLLAFAFADPVGNWWGWIGVVPLVTGIFRRCPAYALTGASTCGEHKGKQA